MGDGIHIEARADFGLATIMARRGVGADAVLGALKLPVGGSGSIGDANLSLIGTGPGAWLALTDIAPDTHAERLRRALGPLASVSDQSGGYVLWRISGEKARTLLQRGAPVDLHPQVFRAGSVAVTLIAHMGVILRQLDDAPSYEIAVFRSYAASFRDWLAAGVAAL